MLQSTDLFVFITWTGQQISENLNVRPPNWICLVEMAESTPTELTWEKNFMKMIAYVARILGYVSDTRYGDTPDTPIF